MPHSDQSDVIERAAWVIHRHYCTLPGVCRYPDEIDRAAAREVLALVRAELLTVVTGEPTHAP